MTLYDKILITILSLFALNFIACRNDFYEENGCEQWDSLNVALNCLYNRHYDNYWKYVAKKNITPQEKKVIFLALHQQYDRFRQEDKKVFNFDEIKMRSENEAEVFYSAVVGNDTLFCSQNMVLEDGDWKIKLF